MTADDRQPRVNGPATTRAQDFTEPRPRGALPPVGLTRDEVMARLRAAREDDVAWREGRIQGFVYFAGEDVRDVAADAMREYYFENILAGKAFPSMVRLEQEVLAIAAQLLHAPAATGVTTTGGTESNLLAVWTAICRARARGVAEPFELVVPYSAHPSFTKAARYFGLGEMRIRSKADYSADTAEMRRAINRRTILIVGSAPAYSHGVVDAIGELGAIALDHDLPLHVDSCVGGFVLPFVERLGRPVPAFDFRVPGVTSVSADVHKHGYAPRALSVLLHREEEARRLGSTHFDGWPNGHYFTHGITGTRSGAVLAGAWAVLNYLGEAGFLRITREVMAIADRFKQGIAAIPDLFIVGDPVANKFAYAARTLDVAAIAEGLDRRGWFAGLQADPPAINMQAQTHHALIVDRYLADLSEVADDVRRGLITSQGRTAAYN
jgi:glutamate/tyrosine decarboxylase-like PLP-dependent enzyme